jgi:uncharacterized protein YjbJ (UPF0337 family)
MNTDIAKGLWKQLAGSVETLWARLIRDDVREVRAHRAVLLGRLQTRFGRQRAALERGLKDWLETPPQGPGPGRPRSAGPPRR